MRKNIKMISVIMTIIIIIGILFLINSSATNHREAKIVPSLISKQEAIENSLRKRALSNKPEVILDPYGNAPLSALILFSSNDEVTPEITIMGKDKHSTFKHKFKAGKEHYLPVYGLYPDSNNKVVLKVNNVEYNLEIKTSKLPEDFILPTSVKSNKEELQNELYFFTPSSKGYTCAYDINGDVRWYLKSNSLWEINKLKNGNLLLSTEKLIAQPYYMSGLYEMNFLGKIFNEYKLPGGYHHDYYEMENGNILIASDNFDDSLGTVEDYIVEVDRLSGEIVKEIDLKDILKRDDGKSEDWTNIDWFHNNSVWFDKKTNSITLSGRHKDAVINIDYETHRLNWIIGDPTNWDKKYQKYFFKPIGDFEWQWSQHSAKITPQGDIFIFDNGNNKAKEKDKYVPASKSYSRGVLYKINTRDMTIKQIWEYGKERKSAFYSPYISNVLYLENNHYIVHSGGISYKDGKISNKPAGIVKADKLVSTTVELKDDKPIFEITLPTNNYRANKMSLYDNTNNDIFSAVSLKGKNMQTKVDESKLGFPQNAKNIKQLKDNDISLSKEVDRLVFNGKFTEKSDVKIILYKNFKINTYNVRVKSENYTAMCVDIFNEKTNSKELDVTKYINSEGLKGKYSIYLDVNNQLYNTNEFVKY